MRFLLDESLSWRVALLLSRAGHDAQHVGELNMLGAPDATVLRAAAETKRILISADTDFGELLALGRRPGPSVVILRRAPHRPEQQAALLIANVPRVEEELLAGAIVSLTGDRLRIRALPIADGPGPTHR